MSGKKNSWSGPGRGRGSMGFGSGGGSSRHPSMLPGGGGKGSSGSNRGYRSFASPKNDGNLYTSTEKLRKTDYLGNHQGAARPSGMGCGTLCALGAIGPFLLSAAFLLKNGRPR